jgi:hypothetical protein
MSTRPRTGKAHSLLKAAGAEAFVLLGTSPAAARYVHDEPFTPKDFGIH